MVFKNLLDNTLKSGHKFSKTDNLLKYRIIFINLILVSMILYMTVRYIASLLLIMPLSPMHESIVLPYLIVNFIAFYLLRQNKNIYLYVVNFIIISTYIVIYLILFDTQVNELRLVWFFTPLFLGFVLIGKTYGLYSLFFIYLSTYLFDIYIGLGYSKMALSTFYGTVTLFSLFMYAFLYKIDKDANEFKLLNDELHEKVLYEVEQRQEQEKMLLRQCRMANMGEMIDAIAHQWRQPLMNINAILMNIDILSEGEKNDQNILNHNLREIAQLTTHMSKTIEDFRSLYKDEKEKTTFSILAMIEDVLSLMKNNLMNIKVKIEGNNIAIKSYKSELTQVIIILISNAIEALKYKKNIEDKQIHITITQNNEYIGINIEDNAGGISEESIDKVFDAYYTTKKQTGGTGLGLHIAQIIIRHTMHGDIGVTNTSKGAMFTLSFPI